MLDEGLDEFVGGVVGAGGGAGVALGKGEVPFAFDEGDLGLELQQALIDGAKLLDIERAVIDPHELAGDGISEQGELAEGAEKGGVVEGTFLQRPKGAGAEEVTTKRSDAELEAATGFIDKTEEGDEGEPGIVVAGVGEAGFLSKTAQASEGVAKIVDVAQAFVGAGHEREATLFNDHEEEEAVDEPKQVGVKIHREAFAGVGSSAIPQGLVRRVAQEAVGDFFDDFLHGTAQAVANAGAGVEGVLMVNLDGSLGNGVLFNRQAGGVEQTVEQRKVGEEFLGENAVEVELDEGEFDKAGGIAEEANLAAVGDDAVEVLGEVEVFLHQTVRGHAGGIRHGAAAVEGLEAADEVNGQAVAGGVAMGDAVGFPLDGLGICKRELIAKEAEEWDEPLVAGLGGAGRALAQAADPGLVGCPISTGGSPGIRNLVLDLGGGIEAEILGGLVRLLATLNGIEDISGEDGAFESDGRVHG